MIGGDGINDESNKTAPAPTRNTDLTKNRWMTHVCTTASGQTTPTASGSSLSPSHTRKNTSPTPRFFSSVSTASQCLAPSAAGEPLGVQGQHDRVHVVQAVSALPDDDGLERAVPVARHLDLDGADRVGHDRLHCGAVTRVRGPALHASLMPAAAEMLGHLLVQGGLQHGPGELLQQAVGTGQVEAPLLRPADHLQRELPLGRGRRRRPALPWLRRGLLADGRLRCHGLHCLSRHAHHRPFPAGTTTGDPEANYTLSETLPVRLQ